MFLSFFAILVIMFFVSFAFEHAAITALVPMCDNGSVFFVTCFPVDSLSTREQHSIIQSHILMPLTIVIHRLAHLYHCAAFQKPDCGHALCNPKILSVQDQ